MPVSRSPALRGRRAATPPPTASPPPNWPWPTSPRPTGAGRRTLIRTDSGCGTREFLNWLTPRGWWLSNAVGTTITETIHHAVLKIQASAWTPAVDPDCEIRDGAWVAELAGTA